MSVDTENDEERKSSQLVDYLQAPRKKRKNYVLIALGKNFDPDVAGGLEQYLRQQYGAYAVSQPRSASDLRRLFSRQVVLLIIDDQFAPIDECMDIVKNLKQKKSSATVPVLFLTENPGVLIEQYHQHLLPYQETDNYVRYRGMPLPRICARIQNALSIKRSRRSRRHRIELPVKYFHLTKNEFFQGDLVDISMHGGLLVSGTDDIFRVNDQLRLHLPIHKFLPPELGEFMRLSAKVRRVLIGGNTVGISWEYLSEEQNLHLTQYVTELINSQLVHGHMHARQPQR